MTESGQDKLLALLFGEGRELVHLRFFPGDSVSSGAELRDAAHEAISLALAGDSVKGVPKLGRAQVHFSELVARL